MTRGRDGAAPWGQGSRGEFLGEGIGKEAVGRLAGRTPKGCPPGVRRIVAHQDAVERGQRRREKAGILLGKAQGGVGYAGGEVAWIERLVLKMDQAINHLECTRE
jgi:hypothetical protein